MVFCASSNATLPPPAYGLFYHQKIFYQKINLLPRLRKLLPPERKESFSLGKAAFQMATEKPMFVLLICFSALLNVVYAIREDDLVKDVPGLIFKTNFKVYSGYLNGNKNGTWKMHYMLTESRNDPKNDPLLFWFNGGPGEDFKGL